MKNKYSSTLFISLKIKCYEFFQNTQVVKSENIKKIFQKVNFLLNQNPKNYFNKKRQDLIKKVYIKMDILSRKVLN